MSTIIAPQSAATNAQAKPIRARLDRRYDRWFFTGMAVLILISVFVGFSRTFFLAPAFRNALPDHLIVLHGTVFSCWILLLVIQSSLISARRVDLHKKLGVAGFLLACLMVILGLLAATEALSLGHSVPGLDPLTFYAVPVGDMLCFSALILSAFLTRKNPAAHKRLILIATIGLLDAAFVRWPVAALEGNIKHALFCVFALLGMVIAYDLWSTQKIQRATIFGSLLVVAVLLGRVPIGMTAPWHAFAGWAQHMWKL